MGPISSVDRKQHLLESFVKTDGHLSCFFNVKSVVLSSFVLIFEWHVGYTKGAFGLYIGYTNGSFGLHKAIFGLHIGYTNGSFGLHKTLFGLHIGYTNRVFGLHK